MAVITPGPGVGPYPPYEGQTQREFDTEALANTWDTAVYFFAHKLGQLVGQLGRL